jgi:hypothetical protein
VDNQIINFHKKYLQIVFFTIAIGFLFLPKIVFSEQYQLELIVDLSDLKDLDTDAVWLEPLANPINNNDFFVAQNNGRVYLRSQDSENNQDTILNLALTSNDQNFISLTAMTLHPSFTRPEHSGYATIFTAHTTKFLQNRNKNRLTLDNTNITFGFETVVTAWKYDFDKQIVGHNTKREVIRIPIKNQDSGIRNLKFDPYQKSWDVHYGQLYFSLNYIDEIKENPLYSGVILRIDPNVFGSLNFTVVSTNPFIKDPTINNEIVVMGIQNITDFFWAKNNQAAIFLQHNINEQYRLSTAMLGDNLLTQSDSKILWQQPNEMSTILLYQGRDFIGFRNKFISFKRVDGKWYLSSLAVKPFNNELPILEEIHSKDFLSRSSHVNIHQDSNGEIILFDNHESKIYSLKVIIPEVIVSSSTESSTIADKSDSYILHISLLTGLSLLLIFLYYKKKKLDTPDLTLDKKHLRLKYEPTSQTISLFKGDRDKEYKTFILGDIIRCEILLNNNTIHIIDDQPDRAFNNQVEANLRAIFSKEYYTKIQIEDTRHIEIVLYVESNSFKVNLYLRKGNIRVTSTKYNEVIELLIELCWSISKSINFKGTETRIIPTVKYFHPDMKMSPKQYSKPRQIIHDKIESLIHVPIKYKSNDTKPAYQGKAKTELVDALDKLVNLHQQGYLSDEEFRLAKTKLLQ